MSRMVELKNELDILRDQARAALVPDVPAALRYAVLIGVERRRREIVVELTRLRSLAMTEIRARFDRAGREAADIGLETVDAGIRIGAVPEEAAEMILRQALAPRPKGAPDA